MKSIGQSKLKREHPTSAESPIYASRWLAVLILGILPYLMGCATQARLQINSDPPGAAISQEGDASVTVQAPMVAYYNKGVLLNSYKDAGGCYVVRGFEARWPSGAKAQSGPIRICGKATGNYEFTISRNSSDPNINQDYDYAQQLAERQRQQREAAAAEERRRAAEQAAITELAIQAALIPAVHNLAPKNRRDAMVQSLAANAATNATLLVDRNGLEVSLSNPTPADALAAAQNQDTQIVRSLRESSDEAVVTRARSIIDRLLPFMHNKPGEFTIRILESDQINAFTTGGRYIYVYTGLIRAIQDDSELAGVLGHELAHIDAGHIGRSANQAGWMGLGALVAAATVSRDDRSKVADGYQRGRATFSREYESEADVLGVVYSRRAGFSPRGLANFFDRQAAANSTYGVSPWLIDHPFDYERRGRILAVVDHLENGSQLSDPISATVLHTLDVVESR